MTQDTADGTRERGDRGRVDLPEHLLERVAARLPRTRFDEPDEYVAYVLEEVLARVEDADEGPAGEAVDEREVEKRLESLGYLE